MTAGGSFRAGGEGQFYTEVTADSMSTMVVKRDRFRGVPLDVRHRRGAVHDRVRRLIRKVARRGTEGKGGFAVGRLRGAGGSLLIQLRGLGSRDGGSRIVGFRRLKVSHLFISRTSKCGGLCLCAGVEGMTNVTRARTLGSSSVFVGYRCLSRLAKKGNIMFTAKAPIDGDVIRLCAVRECLRRRALIRRGLRRFST